MMKNVLITGGSRGIGKAMVRLFCENGYNVGFTYRNSEAAAKELERAYGALAIRADSAVEDDVKNAVSIFRKNIGNLEILINNAAVSCFGLVGDMSLNEWRDVFSVNVDSVFLYSKYALEDMIFAKAGRIINISSMWGIVGSSCEVAYSASKSAVIGFTKALAKEVAPSGITVNAVAPGFIDTDMNAPLSQEDKNAVISETPLLRIGTPEDVAGAVLFLASDSAGFITGEVMNVSGGLIM